MDKVWILGPCVLESREFFFGCLEQINKIMAGEDWYMKSSFDKANRTSIHGGRGEGLDYCKGIWKEAKEEYPNIKLTTDVHEVHQVEQLVGLIDLIQIPAFLCRQTDLIVECARVFDKINVKKGQWLGPDNLIKSVDKIRETNENCEAWVSDRGSNFGYYDLFVNFGIVDKLKEYYDKVILDCTHSIQRSRAVYETQGDRRLAERYFLAADIFNYDGVFAEVHPDPDNSVSDGDCHLQLQELGALVSKAKNISRETYG
tara:strand:+ start:12881 stop:13654 length:774 start_codon:yes stop_codon:yes gene_type:complete